MIPAAVLGLTTIALATIGAVWVLKRIACGAIASARKIGQWHASRAFARERRARKDREQLLTLALTSMNTLANEVEHLRSEIASARERQIGGK